MQHQLVVTSRRTAMRARNTLLSRRFVFVSALLALSACTTPDKVALEEYAPQSPDADIEAVSLSASDDDTFDPERVGTEFPDTTEQVAVWYRWNDADSGKKVGIRWSKDGEVVLEQGDTLAKISGASAYVLKMAAGSKLPIGDYQVELLEDGVAVTKIPFKVGEGAGSEMAAAPSEEADAGEFQDAAAEPEASAPQAEAAAAAEEPAAEEPAAEEPPAESATEDAAVAGATRAPAVAGTAAGALAARETQWPGVVVEVTEFAHRGNALSAKLRFTNNGSKNARPDFYYRDTYVLDENNKKYEVLKDEKGGFLGSVSSGYNYWWGEQMEPGASRTVWMRFQPPPAGVKVMTLQVGTLESFEDIRIRN
jgi:hypothetical protein